MSLASSGGSEIPLDPIKLPAGMSPFAIANKTAAFKKNFKASPDEEFAK